MANSIKKKFFMPVIKSRKTGKYQAILSGNDVDLEGEVVTEQFLQSNLENDFPGLIDHKNEMSKYVNDWDNKRLVKTASGVALVAEPVFFKGIPEADAIKKRLDGGARHMGCSITASITKKSSVNINGKSYPAHEEGIIHEASWTPIPVYQSAKAFAIAKSLDLEEESESKSEEEVTPMSEENVNKEEVPVAPAAESQPAADAHIAPAPAPVAAEGEPAAESQPAAPSAEAEQVSKSLQAKIEMLEKKVSDLTKKQEAAPAAPDRLSVLKAVGSNMPTANSANTVVTAAEPSVANFIAIQKGWKISSQQ